MRTVLEKPVRTAWIAAVVVLTALTVWVITQVPSGSTEAETPQNMAADHPEPEAQAKPAPKTQAGPNPAVANRCPATAAACVDERLRISWLQHDGRITYGPVPVMPGTQGAADSVATPKGLFHVQYKDADHVSGEFGEPMQNAVFFAAGGIAFHQGSLVSTSHGCVHLSPQDSARYYKELDRGAQVAVF